MMNGKRNMSEQGKVEQASIMTIILLFFFQNREITPK